MSSFLLTAAGPARSQEPGKAPEVPDVSYLAEGDVTLVTAFRPGFDMADPTCFGLELPPSSGAFPQEEPGPGRPVRLTLRRSRGYSLSNSSENFRRLEERERSWLRDGGRETVMLFFTPGVAVLTAGREDGGGPGLLDRFTITPGDGYSPEEGLWAWARGAPDLNLTAIPAFEGWAQAWRDTEGTDTVRLHGAGGVSLDVPGGMVVYRRDVSHWIFRSAAEPRGLPPRTHYVSAAGGEKITWERDPGGVPSTHSISIAPPVPLGEALDAEGLTVEAVADAEARTVFGSGHPPAGAVNGNAVAFPHDLWESAMPGVRISGFTGPGELRFSWWDGYASDVVYDSMREFFPFLEQSWRRESIPIPAGVTSHVLRREGWVDDLSFIPAPR